MIAESSTCRLVPTLIVSRRVRLPGVGVPGRRELRRRRPTIVAATVHVRVLGRVVPGAAVGVVVAAARGWVILNRWRSATRGRTIASPPVIIIVPARGRGALTVPIPIAIPARAISTRRAAPVVIVRRRPIRTTRRPRTRPGVSGNVGLSLLQKLADRTNLMGGQSHVGNAGDAGVLELATVQLLNGGSQVGSRLKLDKSKTGVSTSGTCASGGLTYPSLLPLRLVSE